MKQMRLKFFLVLSSLLLLSKAVPVKDVSRKKTSHSSSGSNNISNLISICPTDLRLTEVRRAIHFRTKELVHLSDRQRERMDFQIGRCRSTRPITQAVGICAITMQRHLAYITATDEQVQRKRYQNCQEISNKPGVQECLEWIELPGLCQHKIIP